MTTVRQNWVDLLRAFHDAGCWHIPVSRQVLTFLRTGFLRDDSGRYVYYPDLHGTGPGYFAGRPLFLCDACFAALAFDLQVAVITTTSTPPTVGRRSPCA
jgi:hypothetical protein